VVIGEVWIGKAGGVETRAKKTPCERDPLDELHRLQQANKLDGSTGFPPFLILTT